MIKRFKIWHNNLSTRKQFLVPLLFWWVIWFPSSWIEDWFMKEQHSLTYHVFDTLCMAFFMSALFVWGKFKFSFKKKNYNEQEIIASTDNFNVNN